MMNMITESQLNKITCYIYENARPLDKALYRYYFEYLPSSDVASELKRYQNEDGGFGNAIEPDFRLPLSSPMATTTGLQYASELQLTAKDDIVKNAITYLLTNFDKETKCWHAVPKEVNQYPHAPWWHVNEETNNAEVESNWANPNAEIVSYFLQYEELVPEYFLQEVKELALHNFSETVTEMEMHDLLCYIKLFEALPENEVKQYMEQLASSVKEIVETTRAAWENYGPKPMAFAPTPNALLYTFLKDEVLLQIPYEIEKLKEEGYWEPNWAWGQYEDTWLQAKEEWQGFLTVKMIKSLKEFGYIEKS
jgi:hypothetical protein